MKKNTQLQSNNNPITKEVAERLNKFFTNDTNIKVFAQTLREYNKNVILLSLSHPDILTYAEDIREGYYWANLFADILEDRKDF